MHHYIVSCEQQSIIWINIPFSFTLALTKSSFKMKQLLARSLKKVDVTYGSVIQAAKYHKLQIIKPVKG